MHVHKTPPKGITHVQVQNSFSCFFSRATENEQKTNLLKTVMRISYDQMCREASHSSQNPDKLLMNPGVTISNADEFDAFWRAIRNGRCRLSNDLLTTDPFGLFAFDPAQLCRMLMCEKDESMKPIYLAAMGILGSEMPKKEQNMLGSVLTNFLKNEEKPYLKIESMRALAYLSYLGGLETVICTAEGSRSLELESIAYKTALLISIENDQPRFSTILNRFLIGDFLASTKTSAASLMLSLGVPEMDLVVRTYIEDTDNVFFELLKIAHSALDMEMLDQGVIACTAECMKRKNAEALRLAKIYAMNAGLSEDMEVVDAILPFLNGEPENRADC